MLAKIRKGSNSLLVRIILILIALSFVGAGATAFLKGNSQGDLVWFKEAEAISVEEFQFAKAREVDAIQRQNGISLTDEQIAELGIDNNVLRRLINDAMIKYLAKTYDFDISESKIISYVKRTPYFKNESGEFDLSLFKAAFNNSPRKENEYLTSIKDQIIYSSMASIFMDSFAPASALKNNIVDYMAETRTIDIISIGLDYKPKDYKGAEITSEQLNNFYENNKELFLVPELRSFDYIVADSDYLKKKLHISDTELEKYFNENRNDFPTENFAKAKKQVRELFVQEKMEELASELAKNSEEDVSSGLNIAEIAKKYEINIQSQKEISLANMHSSEKPEYIELADSVFELMNGELSYPIEIQGQNSIFLVELKNTIPSRQNELNEVENEVKKILSKRQLAFENAKAIEEFKKSYNPSEKQNKSKLGGIIIVQNQQYTRAELPMQDKLPADLLKSMFDVQKNEASQLVSDGKRLYFAYVKSIQNNKAKEKKIRENSEEHFANVIKDGIFHELIAYLTYKNKMQILQRDKS